MSELEVILAAVAAGAAGGTAAAAQSAVVDAYTGLRGLLRRAFVRQGHSSAMLDTVEAEPGIWQMRLREALARNGVDRDAEVLSAARALLAMTDPEGTAAGKYGVDARGAGSVRVGDQTVQVDTNYGAVANTMTAPVSIVYGQVPSPPAEPRA